MYKYFCSKCYIRLVKLNNSTHPSERVLKSAKDQIEYANRVWTLFDSTVEVADCNVCCKFAWQSKEGRPVKPGRGPKTPHAQDQSVCNSSSEVGDSSISSNSFQPQTFSTPIVRKQMIDYLVSRTVVNQSNANDNICLPDSDACPLLKTSTPKQQTPSVTNILTPATGTESLQTTKRVENVLPPLSRPKPLCSLKQLQAPLT